MRFPLVARHRLEYAERERKYREIRLEARERDIDAQRTENAHLLELIEELTSDLKEARAQYAGDLQLERTRHDEFVRDMFERLAPTGVAIGRGPSQREVELPPAIQAAIEEVSFGNSSLETHLEGEARRRLLRQEKPDEIAEKIRAGERPD